MTNLRILPTPLETKARGQLAFIRSLQRQAARFRAAFGRDLSQALLQLGQEVERRAFLARSDLENYLVGQTYLLDAIVNLLEPPDTTGRFFRPVMERYYQVIGESTYGVVTGRLGIRLDWSLSDPETIRLLGTLGTRITRLDANGQTRRAIMAGLQEGREAGDGAEALARRIRHYTEGSHLYPGIAKRKGELAARQYRAETIARTETKTAQNQATLSAYRKSAIVEALRVYDGAECTWPTGHGSPPYANGRIVTFREAEQYPLSHPRCVRSFGPVVRGG